MNKREYFSAVNGIVKKAIAARIEAQTALDGVEEKISNRRKYSMEHINKVLEPQRRDLRRQINDAADLAKIWYAELIQLELCIKLRYLRNEIQHDFLLLNGQAKAALLY